MQLKDRKWLVLLVVLHTLSTTTNSQLLGANSDYYYYEPDADADADAPAANMDERVERRAEAPLLSNWPVNDYGENSRLQSPSYGMDSLAMETATECEPEKAGDAATDAPAAGKEEATTDCVPEKAEEADPCAETAAAPTAASAKETTTEACEEEATPSAGSSNDTAGAGGGGKAEAGSKTQELQKMVQHLYVAQARVQLEATEIRKAQAVANSAQQQLEEASGKVRTIVAQLQSAQQEVAAAAIRAQTAQLQLAAHDQLLFAARQDVDALSSQMVGLQAAEGFTQPKPMMDFNSLMERLKQPLPDAEKPTPVPPIIAMPSVPKAKTQRSLPDGSARMYADVEAAPPPSPVQQYDYDYESYYD